MKEKKISLVLKNKLAFYIKGEHFVQHCSNMKVSCT